jgi:hypothetical protein
VNNLHRARSSNLQHRETNLDALVVPSPQQSDDPVHREHKNEEKKETEIQSQIPTAAPGERVVPPETISHDENPGLANTSVLPCHWGETHKLVCGTSRKTLRTGMLH